MSWQCSAGKLCRAGEPAAAAVAVAAVAVAVAGVVGVGE